MNQARTLRRVSLMALAVAGVCLAAGTASAQMYKEPYTFQSTDRAGLAVYMKQLDSSKSNSTTGSGDATYLVCGGGSGGSTATANSSCIILNNSDASLGIGQGSKGGQSANSSTETNSTTTTADQVSNILNAK
jgi:hypothetical protein